MFSLPYSVGDFLIIFYGQPVSFVRAGTQSWEQLDASNLPDSRLFSYAPSKDWKGSPFLTQEMPGWKFYLLGETPSAVEGESLFPIRSRVGDFSARSSSRDTITGNDISSFLHTWNHRFLLFAWEQTTQHWHAWSDRFGTLHAYYASDGQRAALGTYAPAVAAAASSRKLDWQALAGFFALGFFPQDRTHYADMRILRPATHYVFDRQGRLLSQEPYWEFAYRVDAARSYDETVNEFARIFQQVLDDQTRSGRVAVPVSGGLDSRSTVASLTKMGQPADDRLWSYSYGYSRDSIETRIARQVATTRRLPFQAYTIQPYLFENLERILNWTEGFFDFTQTRQAFVRDELAERSDILVGALWGDVWLDEMGLVSAQPDSFSANDILKHTLKKMAKRGRAWLLQNLVAPQLAGEDLEQIARAMAQEELEKLEYIEDADFRVKAFKTMQWSHRWSLASQRAYQSAAWPALVFYDHRLADFFCSVPGSFVSGRRLQIDYLKRFAPDLARINWQVYDANLYQYQHYHTWLLPKRVLQKAQRWLMRTNRFERNWEVQFLNPQGQRGLQRWLLQPGLRLHEYLSPTAIRELLQTFHASPQEMGYGYTVSMLLTFSAWLELHA